MIKLTQLINELEINNPNRATLAQLRRWKIEIEKSDDIITKTKLALKCVEGVIWMWNKSHPHDNRPQKAINAVKTYLKDPSKENMKECENVNTDAWNAYYDTIIADDIAAAAAQLTQSVYIKYNTQGNFSLYAAERAIEAVITYNRGESINELEINKPFKYNQYILKYEPENSLDELEINKPSQINKLKVGQIYKIKYNVDIYDEEDLITDNLKILDKWTDSHGPCVTAIPITEEDNPDDFQLFLWEENIVKVEPYKKINESMNRFVEMNEIGQILLDKFPQHQNKIQEYIKTIEIEPENYEYLTYHHLLDDFKNFVSLNELEINKPEPNSNLFYKLNKNKTEVWNTLLKKRYGDLVLSYYDNFNPETDIKFELGDWSGEKEANVVYLNFSEFEIGWEASIDEKYFNINDDEIIDIKEFNIKGLKFYYITYDV